MAPRVGDLAMITKLWFSPHQWTLDPTIVPLPFNESVYNSKQPLRIGWYTDDNFFAASPACVRAVYEVVQKLKERGHELMYPHSSPNDNSV